MREREDNIICNLRSEGTSARKTVSSSISSNQKFVKTDLAKYENTWRLNPHEVKKELSGT